MRIAALLILTILPLQAQAAAPSNTIDVRTLSADGAGIALAAAEKAATNRGFRVSIAVVDAGGNLLAFKRLGNAMPVSVDNAIGKARTAAQLGIPSKEIQDLVDGAKPSMLAVTGISPLQGGMPILIDTVLVGGIASSGADSEDDEAIARAGAKALAKGD